MRCPECRGGLVIAEQWEEWYARCDDTDAPADLLDERPDGDEEAECVVCAGTGYRVNTRRKVAA